jgi:hypothetical protein
MAEPPPAWSVFQQIFPAHWDGFKRVSPRYATRYDAGLVAQRLRGGHPETIGEIAYRCLPGGAGNHLVAMSCKASQCLRCAKVYVDNWVSHVSPMLPAGVISRPIVLTVPALFRPTFSQNAHEVLSAFRRCGVQC